MDNAGRALSALQHLDAGCDREQWVRIGMSAKDAGVSLADFDAWSSPAPNYSGERDVAQVWKSFNGDGVKAATLFGMAIEAGWKDPAKSGARRINGSRPNAPITKAVKSSSAPATRAASTNVMEVWRLGVEANLADEYIYRKGGKPDGLRVYPAGAPPLIIGKGDDQITAAGALMVPCYAPDGETLLTIQIIPLVGKKMNLRGEQFGNGFFSVGDLPTAKTIYIVEGIGQAWAVTKARPEAAAVVCFGAGRMATVAKTLRDKYPDALLVVVPDRGKENQAAAIAADVSGQWVEMPDDKPSNYDANDYLKDAGIDALAAMLERPKAQPLRFNLLTDADLAERPMLQQRIKDVFPLVGTAAVFGASGSGKSFLIGDAVQSIAFGKSWFDYRVKPCNVIYCALEGEGGIAGRVKAYRIRHGASSDRIRYLLQPFSLLADADVVDLAHAIEAAGGAGVVVLDTLHASAPGADENSAADMGTIIAAAKKLQTLIGGLVILVHHVGKDSSRGLRGHSSLLAALDAAIEVRRDGDNREWCIVKCKDGEDGAAHPFRLDTVELGTDADGDPITSCVIRPVEAAAKEVRRIPPPKAGNQAIIWSALGELFRKAGDTRPEGAPAALPQGRPCLKLEDAIEQTRTRLVCDAKRQTERTQTAITGLINRGLIVTGEGFLWCP